MKKLTLKSVFILCSLLLSSSISAQRFFPAIDTYIDQSKGDVVHNTVNSKRLIVRTYSNMDRVTMLNFNIGDFSEQVSKAELFLYLMNSNPVNAAEEVEIYEVTSGIISNDITWNNFNGQYTLGENPLATLSITSGATLTAANGWYRFDIKDLVNKLAITTGTDKKVKLALKAKTSGLLLTFYSNEETDASHYRPFLVMTPAMPKDFIEKSRESVVEDNFVYNVFANATVDSEHLWVNYFKTADNKQYRYANMRFPIPAIALTADHRVTIKTKVYAAQSGGNPVYVVDLLGMPNIDKAGAVDVNALTWNTIPTAAEDNVHLRSRFFSLEDKNTEADIEWDVTDYVKGQQTAGKTSAVFSLRVPELGGAGGHNIAFYSLNYLNAEADSPKVPQIILYEFDSTVAIDNSEADLAKYAVLTGNKLHVNGAELISGSIFNIQGASLITVKDVSDIDVSSLSQGVYLLKLTDNSVFKFLKK